MEKVDPRKPKDFFFSDIESQTAQCGLKQNEKISHDSKSSLSIHEAFSSAEGYQGNIEMQIWLYIHPSNRSLNKEQEKIQTIHHSILKTCGLLQPF